MKRTIVVSGINITHGGPLSIFEDCLDVLKQKYNDQFDIIALVARPGILKVEGIKTIAFEASKLSYFHKLYYEYIYFRKFSKKLKPYLWISLSNITPNVEAHILVSYYHNAGPFYKPTTAEIFFEPKLLVFTSLLKYFYKINVKKADFIVVQAVWLKHAFSKLLQLHPNKLLVATPSFDTSFKPLTLEKKQHAKREYFYPSFPRVHKNFELVCKAASFLNQKGVFNFVVYLTIDGTENRYSSHLYHKYKDVPSLNFLGLIPREKVKTYYNQVDCLIFSSRLETLGLPLSEFVEFNKPIFVSDLEYAKETLSGYNKVKFFDPADSLALAHIIEEDLNNSIVYDMPTPKSQEEVVHEDWGSLFEFLMAQNQ